jgi:hypothetical protein
MSIIPIEPGPVIAAVVLQAHGVIQELVDDSDAGEFVLDFRQETVYEFAAGNHQHRYFVAPHQVKQKVLPPPAVVEE